MPLEAGEMRPDGESSPAKRNLDAQLEPSTEIKLLGEEARIRFQGLIGTMDDIAQITDRGLTAIRVNLDKAESRVGNKFLQALILICKYQNIF
jgi:hypothetical protein